MLRLLSQLRVSPLKVWAWRWRGQEEEERATAAGAEGRSSSSHSFRVNWLLLCACPELQTLSGCAVARSPDQSNPAGLKSHCLRPPSGNASGSDLYVRAGSQVSLLRTTRSWAISGVFSRANHLRGNSRLQFVAKPLPPSALPTGPVILPRVLLKIYILLDCQGLVLGGGQHLAPQGLGTCTRRTAARLAEPKGTIQGMACGLLLAFHEYNA